MLFFVSAGLMASIGLVLWEWVLDWNDRTGRLRALVPDGLAAGAESQAGELG